MAEKITSIERAAAILDQAAEGSAVERAARLLAGTRQDVVPDMAPPDHAASIPASAPRPFRDESRPAPGIAKQTVSRSVTIDFDALSKRGLLSPLGEKTRIAEEYRLIKRFVLAKAFGRAGGQRQRDNLVMVTSSKPREGKTFTAVNLAISIALERDVHVLLVDADLVRPSILKVLGLQAERGLIELLEDPGLDVSNVMLRTNVEKLSLVPAGTFHHMSPELITSERMAALANDLATRYPDRVIIFDSPPLLATSEPTMLARLVGQIVFVVEAERTSEVAVRAALELIADCPDVMMILNKARSGLGTQHFGSYYSYYGRRKRRR